MKKLTVLVVVIAGIYSCGDQNSTPSQKEPIAQNTKEPATDKSPSYDPNRGEGKFKHVELGSNLDAAMAEKGNKSFGVKCSSCHKLTNEKLVGPGWKGVTSKYKPEWIMNFITNTDVMLNKDPKAMEQLELCLVRMPNQNLNDNEARELLEFMRKNDGVK